MISTFICQHCGRICRCNPRVKNQKYCSSEECQRASRRAWKRGKYATNKSYRQDCLDSQKAWREKYPSCDYQKQYRKNHPEYVKRCSELQKKRYKERREAERKAIEENNVNRNTLFSNPAGDGIYELIPMDGKKNNVNRNTFIVRMQVLSGEEMILVQNSV